MSLYRPRRWGVITAVYWFLLLYIIAALVFWFVSLQAQNREMTELLMNDLLANDPDYQEKAVQIQDAYRRNRAQYIGEGVTFMAVILIGAIFVYRATRRQFRLSHQQQNFMMAVTHELKTPIAVTRLNLETLLLRQLTQEQQKKIYQNSLQETERLNDLISNILLASQLDTGAYKLNKAPVDLSGLSEEVVEDFSQRFPGRNIQSDVEAGVELAGEEFLLKILLNNLVENALKYSPGDKPVTLSLRKEKNTAILRVTDEGNGIPVEERKKVFDKFYRGGNESTRTARGTGLGLFLCKTIARDHNGSITISDNADKGTVVNVVFSI